MEGENIEPLEIVGIHTAGIGSPRNDGSAGSALYRVPIKLNRPATSDEAKFLVSAWDSPPQYTTMHRRGIASVVGDTIILDGTTVDEVERYHAHTLALVVRTAKAAAEALRQRRAQEAERARAEEEAHRRHVEEVASRIKFE